MTARILILGNSHTRMISRAVKSHRSDQSELPFESEICWLTSPGKSVFGDTSREDALAKAEQLGAGDLLVLTWLGTSHNILGLLEHESPFTIMETVDGPVEVPPGFQVIPLSVVRQLLDERIRKEEVVHRFKNAVPCRVVHMMPPPPKKVITLRPRPEDGAQSAEQTKFSPAPCRLALWKLEAALVRRYVTELGVVAYDRPTNTCDEEGFLAETYHALDATHANSDYGTLCLKDFGAMLNKDQSAQNGGAQS